MKFNSFNDTYIYKIEHYTDTAERIIQLPVGLFTKNKQKKKFSVKRDKEDRIEEEKLASSVSRSKRNIRRLCLSNGFEYFATWTVSSQFADRFSVQSVQDAMRKLLKEYQRNNKNFKYIYVIEKHKDGALHFHGMVKGMYDLCCYNDEEKKHLPLYIQDTIEEGRKLYHCKFFDNKLGYNTFSKINNYNACCNYIIKYISKDPVRNENDQVYFCSKGLIKCISEDYLTDIPEIFFTGSYSHTYKTINPDTLQEEERLLCRVKDIYRDSFNLKTKIDYFCSTSDRELYI